MALYDEYSFGEPNRLRDIYFALRSVDGPFDDPLLCLFSIKLNNITLTIRIFICTEFSLKSDLTNSTHQMTLYCIRINFAFIYLISNIFKRNLTLISI